MLTTLDRLKVGMAARVEKVEAQGIVRRRLFDMGLTPGVKVYLRKKAPLGDPLEITIRGYELSLRKDEAKYLEIYVDDADGDYEH